MQAAITSASPDLHLSRMNDAAEGLQFLLKLLFDGLQVYDIYILKL